MGDQLINALLPLGVPGVVIIALAYAYREKDKKLDEVNEKRIAEGREAVRAIEQSTSALETLTEVLRDRKAGQ